MRMTEVGRQLGQRALDVDARAVPGNHRARREAVTKVVHPWSAPVPVALRRGAQARSLRDLREVVARGPFGNARAGLGKEEGRRRRRREGPVTPPGVPPQSSMVDSLSGTNRVLPNFVSRTVSWHSRRSMSARSRAMASLMRSPATASRPNIVENVHARTPRRDGSFSAPRTRSAICSSLKMKGGFLRTDADSSPSAGTSVCGSLARYQAANRRMRDNRCAHVKGSPLGGRRAQRKASSVVMCFAPSTSRKATNPRRHHSVFSSLKPSARRTLR